MTGCSFLPVETNTPLSLTQSSHQGRVHFNHPEAPLIMVCLLTLPPLYLFWYLLSPSYPFPAKGHSGQWSTSWHYLGFMQDWEAKRCCRSWLPRSPDKAACSMVSAGKPHVSRSAKPTHFQVLLSLRRLWLSMHCPNLKSSFSTRILLKNKELIAHPMPHASISFLEAANAASDDLPCKPPPHLLRSHLMAGHPVNEICRGCSRQTHDLLKLVNILSA